MTIDDEGLYFLINSMLGNAIARSAANCTTSGATACLGQSPIIVHSGLCALLGHFPFAEETSLTHILVEVREAA